MNKYKVEFQESKSYVVDVLAKDRKEAIEKANHKFFGEIQGSDTEHYYQVGDTETIVCTVYDVTNTDDPFNP